MTPTASLSPRLIRLVTAIGVAVIATLWCALVVTPQSATRFYTWPWVFYGQLLLLVPIALLGLRLLRRPAEAAGHGMLALAAGAAAIGLSVALSRRPLFSLECALPLWSGLAGAALVAAHLRTLLATPADSERRVRLLSRWGGVALTLPLIASLGWWCLDLSRAASTDGWGAVLLKLGQHRNPHPTGHWNYTGGLALLALPWLATLAWHERGRWRAFFAGATLAGLAVFLSASSRGAAIGALGVLALGGAEALRQRSWRQRLIALALLLAATGALFAASPRLRALLTETSGSHAPNESDVQRLAMLQGGWRLGRAQPWCGYGPGLTPFVYPEIRAELLGGVETAYQLHSAPLQIWVDHGLVGLLALLGIGAALVRSAARWQRTSAEAVPPLARRLALASAGTLGGYGLLALTDYQLDVLVIATALGWHAGWVLATPGETRASNPNWAGRGVGVLLLLAGTALALCLTPAWRARAAFSQAWETAPADAPTHRILQLRRACALAPQNPHYWNHLGCETALAATQAQPPEAAAVQRRLAREAFAVSLALDPAQEPTQAALARMWLPDDPAQAIAHFLQAIRLSPDRANLHWGLALARLAQNDRAGAVHALALECLVQPAFVASPLWERPPLSALRAQTEERLENVFATALSLPHLPVWRRPALAYAQAFAVWWRRGRIPAADALAGATDVQRAFFSGLAAGAPTDRWPPALVALHAACREPAEAAGLLRASAAKLSAEALAGAELRLRVFPGDFSLLVRSPSPNGAGISLVTMARAHFAIMHRNLDGPGYRDFAPRVADAFTMEFAAPLFPRPGLLPGPVLRELENLAAPHERPPSR